MSLGTDLTALVDSALGNTLIPGLTVAPSVTVKRLTSGAFNSTTGSPATSETTVSTTMIPSEYSAFEIGASGGSIQAGDIRGFLAIDATLTDITPTDSITYDGADWRVVSVGRTVINGATKLVEVQLRK